MTQEDLRVTIADIQGQYRTLQRELEFLRELLSDYKTNNKELTDKFDKFFSEFNRNVANRFAAKWVETAMKILIGTVCLGFLAGILEMVIAK